VPSPLGPRPVTKNYRIGGVERIVETTVSEITAFGRHVDEGDDGV
jgi:hypothetical protein